MNFFQVLGLLLTGAFIAMLVMDTEEAKDSEGITSQEWKEGFEGAFEIFFGDNTLVLFLLFFLLLPTIVIFIKKLAKSSH